MRNCKRHYQKRVILIMILVTGATGFVGRNLILSLSKKSDRIIGQFRREKKLDETRSFFIANNKEENFNKIIWRKADITNFSEVQDLFDKVVEVYHCAAYVSMALYKINYLNLVNITGTTYIVDNCINNKIKKLCFISSIAAIGEGMSEEVTEETEWNPEIDKTPYSYSKYGSEMEVWRASQEGVPVVIVNPGIIIGNNLNNSQIQKIIKNKFNFYTSGVSGFVTVEDVVKATMGLMEEKVKNERFILVSENISFKDFVNYISTKNKNYSIRLYKSILYLIWFIESFLSHLRIRNKFLTRALIKSLYSKNHYNGSKICKYLKNFNYSRIYSYLDRC
ncbi:MAG: NAD-dependent epimerase [Flavobacteriaceae bacterium]|nr:NAD-dependent epimerase [Flavobacteriaceae bacterium]